MLYSYYNLKLKFLEICRKLSKRLSFLFFCFSEKQDLSSPTVSFVLALKQHRKATPMQNSVAREEQLACPFVCASPSPVGEKLANFCVMIFFIIFLARLFVTLPDRETIYATYFSNLCFSAIGHRIGSSISTSALYACVK